jgi:hypothetical protein
MSSMWSPPVAQLHVATVLNLAEEALPLLGAIDDSTPPGEELNRRVKFLMETALLLQAVYRSEWLPHALRSHALEIGRMAAGSARHDRLAGAMLMRPSIATEYAVAHGCLAMMGWTDPAFQAVVDTALAAPVASSFQRLPWKELELRWAESMLGVQRPANHASVALPLTFLSRRLDILEASRAEMYHLTHEVIYATDFGFLPPNTVRPLSDVMRDIDGAIARTLDADDFDLCAELILATPFTATPWSPTTTAALTVLMEVVNEFGALPSMTYAPTITAQQSAADRRVYFLRESYHTQYVLAFLMLGTLIPGRNPLDLPAPGIGPAAAVMPRRVDDRQAMWERTSLAETATATAPDLFVDMALLRAYQARDYRTVGELLTNAATGGTRITEQTQDALVRLAWATNRDCIAAPKSLIDV